MTKTRASRRNKIRWPKCVVIISTIAVFNLNKDLFTVIVIERADESLA